MANPDNLQQENICTPFPVTLAASASHNRFLTVLLYCGASAGKGWKMRCKSWFRRRKRENWLLTVGYFITLTFADLISSSPTDDWIQGEEKNTTRLNEKNGGTYSGESLMPWDDFRMTFGRLLTYVPRFYVPLE